MTVSYTYEVANCSGLGCFWKLLFRWRGSVYKLVWPDLLLYIFLYYSLKIIYLFLLNPDQKRIFESISQYCQQYTDLIPVSFILGFYVSLVLQRWWAQYSTIPSTQSLGLFVTTLLHGQDERSRMMRRTVMRYANLSRVFIFIMVSPPVKKRFPTLDHLINAGSSEGMASCYSYETVKVPLIHMVKLVYF